MSSEPIVKPLLRALNGETVWPPPIWLMRQAGRYLPEYRALRKDAGSFMDLCLSPERATEITLQPIRRFGMDAAILFSDILMIPYGLGQKLWFVEGEGPKLAPKIDSQTLSLLSLDSLHEKLSPVAETVARVRSSLVGSTTTLIGFAGSPWTVAAYMVEGGSSRDFEHVKGWAWRDPAGFNALLDILVEATVIYLGMQIDAGAEALQLFDSWAGALPDKAFKDWVIEPNRRIVAAMRAKYPGIPILAFPRGAGLNYPAFARAVQPNGLSLDTSVPIAGAIKALQGPMALQGNLDPIQLLVGGPAFDAVIDETLKTLAGGPTILNLGHGVVPPTPPDHVGALVARVRAFR